MEGLRVRLLSAALLGVLTTGIIHRRVSGDEAVKQVILCGRAGCRRMLLRTAGCSLS